MEGVLWSPFPGVLSGRFWDTCFLLGGLPRPPMVCKLPLPWEGAKQGGDYRSAFKVFLSSVWTQRRRS